MGCQPAFRQAAAFTMASRTLMPNGKESVTGLPMLNKR